ncbi:hypothetical protein [Streptomyces sp. BBFR109]|uniref:hypothetical protein n=1 Tax=Streptomyces sp. BBFR109 TaxID=3448172 RepID=UPI003F776E98
MSGPRTVPGATGVPGDPGGRPAAGTRPSPPPPPPPGTADGDGGSTDGGVTEVLRWAAFSCALVPAVLLWYGTPPADAAGTALGLAAVTGACRVLLRQSERGAARLRAEERVPHRGRRRRTGTGAHRGHRHPGGTTPAD